MYQLLKESCLDLEINEANELMDQRCVILKHKFFTNAELEVIGVKKCQATQNSDLFRTINDNTNL